MSTELADMALRSVIARATKPAVPPDEWDIGYLRGQIAVVNAYFSPTPELVAQADRAVDELRRKVTA
jgi:hypothetical protein